MAYAKIKYIRISPFKARQVLNLIKNKNAQESINILKFTPKKAARIILKVLNSAIANFKQKKQDISLNDLWIKEAYVDNGPILKRTIPRAFGRANLIRKRTSHITIRVEEGG
jgi:large subunit ribosomal protein L22